MTPEQQKLREAVIAAIKAKGMYAKPRTVADAAIAVVLKEAAKVAEGSWYALNVMYYSEDDKRKAKSSAFDAAAAILELIPTGSHSSD